MEAFLLTARANLEAVFGGEVQSSIPSPPGRFPFLAHVEASSEAVDVRVWFGDKESVIGTAVSAPGANEYLDLAFLLRALGESPEAIRNSAWVLDGDRLDIVLAAHHQALQAAVAALREKGSEIWDLVRDEQRKNTAAMVAERRADELRRADVKAAAAFRNAEYGEVIRLLSPYEDILSGAQATKLRLATERHALS